MAGGVSTPDDSGGGGDGDAGGNTDGGNGSGGTGGGNGSDVSRDDTDLFELPRRTTPNRKAKKPRKLGADGLSLVQNDDLCYDDKAEG